MWRIINGTVLLLRPDPWDNSVQLVNPGIFFDIVFLKLGNPLQVSWSDWINTLRWRDKSGLPDRQYDTTPRLYHKPVRTIIASETKDFLSTYPDNLILGYVLETVPFKSPSHAEELVFESRRAHLFSGYHFLLWANCWVSQKCISHISIQNHRAEFLLWFAWWNTLKCRWTDMWHRHLQ